MKDNINQPDDDKENENSDPKTISPILDRADSDETIIATSEEVSNAVLSGWGSAKVDESTQIAIYVKGFPKPIVVRPTKDMFFGRGTGATPQLNMADYGGKERGVSRTHAALRKSRNDETGELEFVLVDLGSTNGTFLNEEQMSPKLPYTLHDGDTIRLGKLVTHIYFSKR